MMNILQFDINIMLELFRIQGKNLEFHILQVWEVKDGKMYRGHLVSQPINKNDDTTESYYKVKV